jgi:K+/H+ antiporter YhaU regulatory subunit KhtT
MKVQVEDKIKMMKIIKTKGRKKIVKIMKDKRNMMMVIRAQKQKANRAKEICTHTQHTTQ